MKSLYELLQSRDAIAWDEFYDENSPELYGFVCRLLRGDPQTVARRHGLAVRELAPAVVPDHEADREIQVGMGVLEAAHIRHRERGAAHDDVAVAGRQHLGKRLDTVNDTRALCLGVEHRVERGSPRIDFAPLDREIVERRRARS